MNLFFNALAIIYPQLLEIGGGYNIWRIYKQPTIEFVRYYVTAFLTFQVDITRSIK